MVTKKQTISHPSQLNGLSVLPPFRFPGKGVIEINDLTIDTKTREQWEHDLNKYYFGCGCDKATIGLFTGIAAIIVWHLFDTETKELSLLMDIAVSAGILFLFTAVGKFTGLLLIQNKLNALIRQISEKWKVVAEPASEPWHCG